MIFSVDFGYTILAGFAAAFLSLLVAIIMVQKASWANYLIRFGTPFAAGVLLIAAFRDLLPHGIQEQGSVVLNATLIAIVLFFLIEKGFKNFHPHHEEDLLENENSAQGWLFLIGDFFHNFVDGIALGAAFLISPGTGVIAAIALVAHEIPLEVGEFGLQLRSGFSKRQTIIRNLLSSGTLIVGAIFAFQFGSEFELPLGYLYGGIAGFFIYIALSDIVPTIHSSESKRFGAQTAFLVVGLIFGTFIASYAHNFIADSNPHDHPSSYEEHEAHIIECITELAIINHTIDEGENLFRIREGINSLNEAMIQNNYISAFDTAEEELRNLIEKFHTGDSLSVMVCNSWVELMNHNH